jgi:hypothetical protein
MRSSFAGVKSIDTTKEGFILIAVETARSGRRLLYLEQLLGEPSMTPARKFVVAIVACLALCSTCSSAQAWYFFTVSGPGNTPIALVAQQIIPAPFNGAPAAFGKDYIYRVKNIGAANIDGFSIFTGPAGGVLPQTYTGTPPATNPGFLQGFGVIGNASVPFLTGEGNTFSPVAWRFDEYDNRAAGPVTRYVTHWVAPAGFALPPNRWTEFDLFSTNPPVTGGGAVDIDGPGSIGVDIDGQTADPGNSSFYASFTYNQQVTVDSSPDTSNAFPGSEQFGDGSVLVPEPSSMALLAVGGLLVTLRRFRNRTSQPAR